MNRRLCWMPARNLTNLNFLAGIQHNRLFIVILAVTSVLQVVLVEYCGTFAGTTSMTARHWGVTVGIGALSLPWGVIIKLFPVFDKSPFQIWSMLLLLLLLLTLLRHLRFSTICGQND